MGCLESKPVRHNERQLPPPVQQQQQYQQQQHYASLDQLLQGYPNICVPFLLARCDKQNALGSDRCRHDHPEGLRAYPGINTADPSVIHQLMMHRATRDRDQAAADELARVEAAREQGRQQQARNAAELRSSGSGSNPNQNSNSGPGVNADICTFYLLGHCRYGSDCWDQHPPGMQGYLAVDGNGTVSRQNSSNPVEEDEPLQQAVVASTAATFHDQMLQALASSREEAERNNTRNTQEQTDFEARMTAAIAASSEIVRRNNGSLAGRSDGGNRSFSGSGSRRYFREHPFELTDAISRKPESDPDRYCDICFELYVPQEMIGVLPCFHHFHSRCVSDWLSRKAVCPSCKMDVTRSGSQILQSLQ